MKIGQTVAVSTGQHVKPSEEHVVPGGDIAFTHTVTDIKKIIFIREFMACQYDFVAY